MSDKKTLSISPKENWTEEQWGIYRKMSWAGRLLADVMVLMPGVSRWVASHAIEYENGRRAQRTVRAIISSRAIPVASRPNLRSLRES
jgi:hypothetical protein